MTEEQRDFAPHTDEHQAKRSGNPGLGKLFAVVFVAALVGSLGGIILNGLTATGNAVNVPAHVAIAKLLDNDPVKGNPNAPVTIVEFSDFQCPFCGRFYSQTLPQIQTDYIDTGKVKLVYRDFPLSFHPNARPAAEAAECANEQGKFWEFHDKIFQNQDTMSTASYKQWAGELGIDQTQFDSCVDSRKYQAEVQADVAAGSANGVSGTPSFFIGPSDGNGKKVVGAQPYATFQAAIDALLR